MVEEAGLEYQFAWNYWEMGEILRVSGNLEEASIWFERSHPIFEKFDDRVGSSFYYRGMADIALARKEYQLAQESFAKSAELSRAVKHTWTLIYALNGLGKSQIALQNLSVAAQYFEEALELSSKVKDKGITLVVLGGMAELFTCLGQLQEAIKLSYMIQNHFASWRETKDQMTTLLTSLKKSSKAEEYKQAQKAGRSLDLWETVDRLILVLEKRGSAAPSISTQEGLRKRIPGSA
jgi:tetratricopeptide (TPR) repeat protein